MGQFEFLFRSELTAKQLADKLYQVMVADGIRQSVAEQEADLAEFGGRAASVRALENYARSISSAQNGFGRFLG